MNLEDLRREYSSSRIGPAILAEVQQIVRNVVRRYDPRTYAGVAHWDDAEEDVVQGVVTELLLGEGQLDYLMATSTHEEDFRRLLIRQVKRYLARHRQRSVIDNLLDRARALLSESRFETRTLGGRKLFALVGSLPEEREPTEAELYRVARTISLIPRVHSGASERAPVVYSTENLIKVLVAVAAGLPCPFSVRDLHRILELVLTDWIAGLLEDVEDVSGVPALDLAPEELTVVNDATSLILAICTDEERQILRRKLENVSDREVAAEMGVSRQTIAARKAVIFDKMRSALEDLPERLKTSTVERIGTMLALPPEVS